MSDYRAQPPRRYNTGVFFRYLAILFWVIFPAFVVWTVISAVDDSILPGLAGYTAAFGAGAVMIGLLALSSGLLMAHHRRTNTYNDPERYWTGRELFYAVVFVVTLFCSMYFLPSFYFSL